MTPLTSNSACLAIRVWPGRWEIPSPLETVRISLAQPSFFLGLTVTGAILGSQDRLQDLSLASFPGLVPMGPGADIA